jgi:MarR family transcriptional regulator, organic hydroperoxide resistance regulator
MDPVNRTANRLSDSLCFSIYSTNLVFCRAFNSRLKTVGITYPQYIAILALSEQDNQNVSGLGAKLFLESNTLTPILKKLESLKYLHRERNSTDERKVIVGLTAAGRHLREGLLDLDFSLTQACGLTSATFSLQSEIATVRDRLIRARRTAE